MMWVETDDGKLADVEGCCIHVDGAQVLAVSMHTDDVDTWSGALLAFAGVPVAEPSDSKEDIDNAVIAAECLAVELCASIMTEVMYAAENGRHVVRRKQWDLRLREVTP